MRKSLIVGLAILVLGGAVWVRVTFTPDDDQKPKKNTPVFSNHSSTAAAYDRKKDVAYVKLGTKYCQIPLANLDAPVGDGRGTPVQYDGRYAIINGTLVDGVMPDFSEPYFPTIYESCKGKNFKLCDAPGTEWRSLMILIQLSNNNAEKYYNISKRIELDRKQAITVQSTTDGESIYSYRDDSLWSDDYKLIYIKDKQYQFTTCYEKIILRESKKILGFTCSERWVDVNFDIKATYHKNFAQYRDQIRQFVDQTIATWCHDQPQEE